MTILTTMLTITAFGQTPVVYINFVSHNEPNENLHTNLNYQAMKTKVLQLATIIDSKGASWNLQTCDGFARGAYNNEVNPILSNVFKTLTTTPYADNIEIDPRPKTSDTILYNIADTWHYLDTLGCNPTQTVGGFLYYTQNQTAQPIDWWKFQDTITAKSFPWEKWKANLMWGAGSYMPHTNDLNDYGIWKPNAVSYTATLDSFYVHNPNNTVWYIGNGCQPINSLDSIEDINDILNPLRSFIDSVQTGLLPQNKFYVYSVTINQREFGSTLFQKISQFCDTINTWGTAKVQWKKLTEKFSLFQSWQTTSGLQYSQWNCGQSPVTGILESEMTNSYPILYPNPSNGIYQINFSDNHTHHIEIRNMIGQVIFSENMLPDESIDISNYDSGFFICSIDGNKILKLIKQ